MVSITPILRRELYGILQTPKTIYLQLGFLLVLAMVVLTRWPTDAHVDTDASQAREVFQLFGYGLMTLLLMLIPAFPAVSIVKEKNQGTLQLLFNSPLSSTNLFLGKMLGIACFVVWLLALSTPALATCHLMGGISLGNEVLLLYLTLLVMALEIIAIGLLISTYCQTNDSALRVSYAVIVLLSVLLLIPNWFAQGKGGIAEWLTDQLHALSPIAAIMSLIGHGNLATWGLVESESVVQRYLLFTPLLVVAISVLAISRMNYRLFDRSRSAGRITNERSFWVQLSRSLLYVVDPQRRSASYSQLVNPVLIKEFRTRRFGRLHWIYRLMAFCAVASIAITLTTARESQSWGVETVGGVMVLLQLAMVLLLMPAISASLISSEVESGGWALLKMTPMSIARIVIGKLVSALIPATLILLGTLPGYLVLMSIEPEISWQIQRVMISLLLTALMSVLVGAAISSLIGKTAVSTSVTYSILLGMIGATFLIWLGRDAPFGHQTVETVLLINPVAAALSDMSTPGFRSYLLTPVAWWISGGISLVSLTILCFRTWQLSRPR